MLSILLEALLGSIPQREKLDFQKGHTGLGWIFKFHPINGLIWKRLFLAIFNLQQGKCCNGSTEPICSRWSPCFLVQGKNTCCISETSKLNSWWPSQLPPIERNPSRKWKVTGKFNSNIYIYIFMYNYHLTCNIIISISNTQLWTHFMPLLRVATWHWAPSGSGIKIFGDSGDSVEGDIVWRFVRLGGSEGAWE